MNHQNFATYTNKPPYYNEKINAYYDQGQGIPEITDQNMTLQDIYRTSFAILNETPVQSKYQNSMTKTLKNLDNTNELKNIFFSKENINRIQKKIKKEIYIITKSKIKLSTNQDESDLLIVMRAIYLEFAKYNPDTPVRQSKFLNKKVLKEIIPGVMSNIKQYYGYLKDINQPIQPMLRPTNSSNRKNIKPSITTKWI